ncbi:hypothetical protein ACFL59_14255, partial [Planctomycetota bacterium]
MQKRSRLVAGAVLLSIGLVGLVPAVLDAQQTTAAGAPLQLEDVMPPDSILLLSVPDLQQARTAFGKTRLKALLKEFKPFVDALHQGLRSQVDEIKGQFARGAGFSLDEALGALGGGIQVGVMGLDQERGAPNLVALIRTDGREAEVRSILSSMERKIAGRPGPQPFTHKGTAVKNLVQPPLFYAEVGKTLLLTLLPDDMKRLIDGASGAVSGATLRQSQGFASARQRTAGGSPVLFSLYANFEPVKEIILKQVPGDKQRKQLETLGLSELKALDLAVTFQGELISSRFFLSSPSGGVHTGVLGLFEHGAADLSLARFAPKSSYTVAVGRFDLGVLYDRALGLIGAVEPDAMGEVTEGIAKAEEAIGFSIRKELLGPVGSDWVMASFPARAGGLPLTMISVGLKSPEGFVAAFQKAAKTMRTELASMELDGRTYRYLLTPLGRLGQNPFEDMDRDPNLAIMQSVASAVGQAWTIDGGRLYLADMPHTLADYFEAMGEGGSFQDTELWRKATAGQPKGVQSLTVNRPGAIGGGLYNLVVRVLKAFEGFGRQAGIPLDLNRLPRYRAIESQLTTGQTMTTLDEAGLYVEATGLTGELDSTVVVVGVTAVIAAIAIPNLIQARKAANETGAIATLRTIVTCQTLYRDGDKDGDGVPNYATSLAELAKVHLIDMVLATGMKQGY